MPQTYPVRRQDETMEQETKPKKHTTFASIANDDCDSTNDEDKDSVWVTLSATGSSADKARPKAATTGIEAEKGWDSSRCIESATGGSADKAAVTVAKKVVQEEVDTDEFEFDSD